jgi:glycosyltransferase involved in cell wall biosynthesis
MVDTIFMTYFLDFYLSTNYLFPRVRKHLTFVSKYFDKIYIVTLDHKNFTMDLGISKVSHINLCPLNAPRFLKAVMGTIIGVLKLINYLKQENGKRVAIFSSPYALYAVFAARLFKIPLVVDFKYDPTTQPSINLWGVFRRLVLNLLIDISLTSATLIRVTTPLLKQSVVKRGIAPEKIIIVPNYADEEIFSPKVSGYAVRKKLSVSSNEKVIMYIGRLSPEKGIDILIKAFSIVKEEIKNTTLIIVGDGPEKGKLMEQCKRLNLLDKVKLVKPVPNNKVPYLLASSDIIVLPSYSEGNPKILVEAMMMGKPIVATNIPGINDVVENKKEALLVKPGDPVALAHAIKTLLNDKTLASTLAFNARKRALEKYSKLALLNLYRENPLLLIGI